MKIRIADAGYHNFTGEMGHIEFKDGVSVSDNLNADFVRSLGGIVRLEQVQPQATPAATPGPTPAPTAAPIDPSRNPTGDFHKE